MAFSITYHGEDFVFKKTALLPFLGLLVILGACDNDADAPAQETLASTGSSTAGAFSPQPDPSSQPGSDAGLPLEIQNEGIFISEVLPGVPGNNNLELIELYNAADSLVDLQGWSLWYSLGSGQEETLVYSWDESAIIPGHGHFLLVRSGQDIGTIPDGTYDVSIFERKGGLLLRDSQGNAADQVGWGDAPEGFFAGSPASAPENGASLERRPGGDAGSAHNSSNNADDFIARAHPEPQNSGSPTTPSPERQIEIYLEAPSTVEPGEDFVYLVHVDNRSGQSAAGVSVTIPIPNGYTVVELPEDALELASSIQWDIGRLADGETRIGNIHLRSPFTYSEALISGYFVDSDELPPAFGPVRQISVAGGSIPIANARQLVGNQVTVEGIATMFTGGFFAGSTGTKFYMEDESGGIQVYVPGGAGQVEVDIGDLLRVTGDIEPYRDSLELVPNEIPEGIEVLEPGVKDPEPTPITINDNEANDAILGMLNVVEGTATQIEEFTYDYQIELADDVGNTTLVLIEKDTGVTAEFLEAGRQYRITGISEFYDGARQIKPRLQSDLEQIFPPVLMLELQAPISIMPGETLTYSIKATNHTAGTLTDLHIWTEPPSGRIFVSELLDDGLNIGGDIVWIIDRLEGDGSSVQVNYTIIVEEEEGESITAEPVFASAEQWREPVETEPYLTFVGSGVPIWAIQGSGDRSPYIGSQATTEGVVTGIFPDLSGFWIQELETDEDPATSSGIFILADEFEIPVEESDLVRVSGTVREISSQTTLHVLAPQDIEIIDVESSLPPTVDYNPPRADQDALAYKESLEGMLVSVDEEAVVIGPTTRYGEYVLLRESWDQESARRTDEAGHFIFVDDGSEIAHENQSTLFYPAVTRGDVITGLIGPLAYTFGQYKIEPVDVPEIIPGERPLPAVRPARADEFSVATFNVENLFDLLAPHPSSPPLPTLAEYRLKLNKIAEAILAMGAPTIIGLQEVENIDILEDLVEQEQIAIFDYVPYLIEGTDERGIDVAFLVRNDIVSVDGVKNYPAPEGLTSRPPLVITATLHLDQGEESLYVINNHFSSLSSGEEATEPRRTAQAGWNATLVERIHQLDPDGHIIVMGDLNSFVDTPPLQTLEEAGLIHVYEFLGPEEQWPYSYIFQGATQTLDHILASEGLYTHIVLVDALHINADFPIMDLEDTSARHVSDHDPLVVIFSFAESLD